MNIFPLLQMLSSLRILILMQEPHGVEVTVFILPQVQSQLLEVSLDGILPTTLLLQESLIFIGFIFYN